MRRGHYRPLPAGDGQDAVAALTLELGANHFILYANGCEEDKNIGMSVNGRRRGSASAARRRGLAGVVLSTVQRRKKKISSFSPPETVSRARSA
jgi:hypothetical protein